MSMDDERIEESATASDRYADEPTPWREEKRLRTLYVERRQSVREMAGELGCTEQTVRTWLDKYGIESPDPPWTDPSVLKQLRSEGLSQAQIGERLDCSATTVKNWMHEFEMDTSRPTPDHPWHDEDRLRTLYVDRELTIQETAEELGCHWLTVRKWLGTHDIEVRSRNPEIPNELRNREKLLRLYRGEGMSTYQIADELDCAPSTVHDYLSEHDIETRSIGSQSGELHHRWKGGYDPYYGANWHETRRDALARDDYQCQECGLTNSEHEETHGSSLDIHHKRPLRTFDEPEDANTLDNLISLCRGCHNKREGTDQ